jgi:hypothetical protein
MLNIVKIKNIIHKEISNLYFFLNKTDDSNLKKEFLMICSYLHNSKSYLNKERIIKKIHKLEYLSKYLNNLCCHDFVEDYIDLDPEFSQKIIYCQKCEYTLSQ